MKPSGYHISSVGILKRFHKSDQEPPIYGDELAVRHARLRRNKCALVEARRREDNAASVRLSQEREKLKRGWCQICGVVIKSVAKHCMAHQKGHNRSSNPNPNNR